MQTACPWCSHPLVVEDANVPAQAFMLRCPKCQGAMQVPGGPNPPASVTAAQHGPTPDGLNNAQAASAPAPRPSPPAETPPSAPPAPSASGGDDSDAERALVALEDQHAAATLFAVLRQAGYAIDTLDDEGEKLRLLHQGDYKVVATSHTGPKLREGITLYQRMAHLSPESRRGTFLILLGDQFKTGDGTQAFVAAADLVANNAGAQSVGVLLRSRMDERSRVYRAFADAERARLRRR